MNHSFEGNVGTFHHQNHDKIVQRRPSVDYDECYSIEADSSFAEDIDTAGFDNVGILRPDQFLHYDDNDMRFELDD